MSLYLQYVFRIGNIKTLGLYYFPFHIVFSSATYFLSISFKKKTKQKNLDFENCQDVIIEK